MPRIKEHYRHKLLPPSQEFLHCESASLPCCGSASPTELWFCWFCSDSRPALRMLNDVSKQHVVFPAVCLLQGSCLVCLLIHVFVCECDASWGYQSECNNRLIWACRLTYNITYNISVPPILCLCMYARMNNSKFWTVICIDNAMTQRQFHIGAPRAFLFYFIYFDPIVPAMFAEIHVLCPHIHIHMQTCINVYSYSI